MHDNLYEIIAGFAVLLVVLFLLGQSSTTGSVTSLIPHEQAPKTSKGSTAERIDSERVLLCDPPMPQIRPGATEFV